MNRSGEMLQHLRQISAKKGSCKLRDAELLERFVAQRDETAFEILLARHGPMVLNVCRRVLPEQHLVEDAFQATFLVLVRKASSISKRELLTNWLYGVAYRTAARAKVEAAKRRARESAVVRKQAPDPLAEISARELIAVLDEELSGLPPQYRGPLVLCYLEGKTRDETARQFGWSLATLARRLERGREMLRARLDRRGLGLPMTLFSVILVGGTASASVPPSLAASTVAAAVTVGVGPMTTGVISANVVALAEGVLKTMYVTKLKTAMAMLLLVGMLGAGVGTALFTSRTQAQPPAKGASSPAATNGEKTSKDAKKDKAEALKGTWACVSTEVLSPDGAKQKAKFEPGITDLLGPPAHLVQRETVTIDGKKWVQETRGDDGKVKVRKEFDITVDAEKDPPRLTIHTTRDKLKIRSIYEVKGDTLRRSSYSLGEEDGVEVVAWPNGFDLDKEDAKKFPRLDVYKRVGVKVPAKQLDEPKERKEEKPQEARKPVVVREAALLQRMAMSADGEVMATVGATHDGQTWNSTVKLWDVRTGKLKRALDEEKDRLLQIAFSRKFLAVGVGGKLSDTERGPLEIRLLDAKTLELKHKIDGTLVPDVYGWSGLAFSPDGKRLAIAGSTFNNGFAPFLKLWDVEKQKLIEGKADVGEIPRERNEVGCLAFSPDGKLVAAAWRDSMVRLFDGQTGDFRTLLDPKLKPAESGHGITGIAFSPDSKTLASKGGDNTVVLWDLTEGKPRQTLKGHKGQVDAVAFSKDGRWIATGGATAKENAWEVILWDAKTGDVKQSYTELTEPVNVVAFSPDGKTLAVCGGGGRGEGKDTKMTGEITLIRLE